MDRLFQGASKTGVDIGLLADDGDHRSSVYLGTAANERLAIFSPDGKWMAYASDESGQYEIYVQTIPAGGAKFQISTEGGNDPAWKRDGKELFYLDPDQKLMAVPVKIDGATFEPGTPQALFTAGGATNFAVTRDGQRFLANVPAGGENAADRTAADDHHQLAGGAAEISRSGFDPHQYRRTPIPRSRDTQAIVVIRSSQSDEVWKIPSNNVLSVYS